MPRASPQRNAQAQAALGETLTLEAGQLLFDAVRATFTRGCNERAATPLDESDTEVQRDPVEQVHAPNEVRLLVVELYWWVVVTTGSGRQSGIHDGCPHNSETEMGWVVARAGARENRARVSPDSGFESVATARIGG